MLADALQTMGHTVSPNSVRKLLRELGYHRQANRRAYDERHHNDRSAQLKYIGEKIIFFLDKNQPVISVEVKKRVVKNKLKIGPIPRLADQLREGFHVENSNNSTGEDIIIFDDVSDDDNWVSVGVTGSAVEFLITAIRSWFETIGKQLYPRASHLAITINCGGLEKTGLLLWKHWLQDLADEIRMTISVLHLPPATTKWRRVEHRLLCQHVSQNCRGQPSINRLAVIELVGASTEAHAVSSENEINIKIGRENAKFNFNDVAALNIQCDAFHPNWNYAIAPRYATKR